MRGPSIRRHWRPVAAACAAALLLVSCGDGSLPGLGGGDDPGDEPGEPPATLDPDIEPPPDDPDEDGDDDGDGDGDGDADDEEPAVHAEPPEVPAAYEALPEEIRPNAKTLASRVAEALTNYGVEDDLAVVASEAAHGGRSEGLRVDADPLLHDDAWSRGRVVYPQLAGMGDDETAVMVVVAQTVGRADGSVQEQTRTLDVRLTLRQGAWAFDELASAGGKPVPRPDGLPAVAEAVLDDDRIDLPDSSRWDIHRGGVHEDLLRLMSRLADRTPFRAVVLSTGHPWEVYGTDRQSKHTMGMAVDVYRLGSDGPRVIEATQQGSRVHHTVQWLYEQPELSEVGSPWALDGYGGRSFSDALHQDHLHIAVGDRDDEEDPSDEGA